MCVYCDNLDSDRCIECFGDYNKWDYAKNVAPSWADKKEFDMTPPFQTLPIFDDWTSYLLVREPWDRFISGLITEMDNGIGSPWIYDNIANTEEGWEKYYTHAKRMLFFVIYYCIMIVLETCVPSSGEILN